jgi:ornithine cyclodeaminase/alanine dehydrogenase-like protein (mu-crystallin family)
MGIVRSVYAALDAQRVEMPPKIGVHSRPEAFLHAMPSYLIDDDVVALKWVSGYPDNASKGLPYIQGIVVVNDADTGVPLAILDGAEITAARTAAASAACVDALAPEGWSRVAILGCGEQGRFHAEAIAALHPQVEIRAYDPNAERAESLHSRAVAADSPEIAVRGADVVVSACPLSLKRTQTLEPEWLEENCLLLPIDFDFFVGPELVGCCPTSAVDSVEQYQYYKSLGNFAGWPDIEVTTGALLRGERPEGRILVSNLGVGALDAAFASSILSSAMKETAVD